MTLGFAASFLVYLSLAINGVGAVLIALASAILLALFDAVASRGAASALEATERLHKRYARIWDESFAAGALLRIVEDVQDLVTACAERRYENWQREQRAPRL